MTCLTYLRTLPLAPAAVVVCCLLLAVVNSTSSAAVIEYSWEGTIAPLDPNEDPWDIGAEGKPFFVSGTVDENAVDFDTDVRNARFNLLKSEVLIDGVPATVSVGGNVFFGDRDSRDLVSFSLDEVEFRGVREGFFTVATLPSSTFTLTQIAESPFLFSPATTISPGGAESDRSSYSTFTGPDRVVRSTLIPEPSTFVLTLLAAICVGLPLRRLRKRQGNTMADRCSL